MNRSDLFELAGIVCLAIAAALVSPALGLAVTGCALIVIGLATERSDK